MIEFTGTPGPWTLTEDSDSPPGFSVDGPDGMSLMACVYLSDFYPKELARKNLSLAALAPEMLTVLQDANRLNKVVNNWLTGGRDVCLVCGELPESGLHDEDCWVPKAESVIQRATGKSQEERPHF